MAKGKLDPQIETLLQQMQAQGVPPVTTLTPMQARESRNPVFVELGGPRGAVAHVENLNIPSPGGGIPIRVYTPNGSGPFPVLLYFHGGGWVILQPRYPQCPLPLPGKRGIVPCGLRGLSAGTGAQISGST